MINEAKHMATVIPTINLFALGFYCQAIHKKFLRRFDTILGLNDDEKWSRKKYFKIPRWPSEIPANLLGQFSLSGQICLHWAAATLKVIMEFQNNFFYTPFHHHF